MRYLRVPLEIARVSQFQNHCNILILNYMIILPFQTQIVSLHFFLLLYFLFICFISVFIILIVLIILTDICFFNYFS